MWSYVTGWFELLVILINLKWLGVRAKFWTNTKHFGGPSVGHLSSWCKSICEGHGKQFQCNYIFKQDIVEPCANIETLTTALFLSTLFSYMIAAYFLVTYYIVLIF